MRRVPIKLYCSVKVSTYKVANLEKFDICYVEIIQLDRYIVHLTIFVQIRFLQLHMFIDTNKNSQSEDHLFVTFIKNFK